MPIPQSDVPPIPVVLDPEVAPFALTLEEYRLLVGRVVAEISEVIGLPLEAVRQVVVANAERFVPTCTDLLTAAGLPTRVTQTELYEAVARAVPDNEGPVGVRTSIVLRDFIAALSGAFYLQFEVGDTQADQDAPVFFAIVAHELGHAMDHHLRGVTPAAPTALVGDAFIRQFARYYADVVAQEFVACALSAPAVPEAVTTRWVNEWSGHATDITGALTTPYAQHRANLHDTGRFRAFALEAAAAMWILCVQYAKLVGTQVGGSGRNRDLPPLPDMFWNQDADFPPADIELAQSALRQLEAALHDLWGCYPNWTADVIVDALLPPWSALGRAFRLDFVEGDSGGLDGLFFRSRRPPAA